MKRLVIVLGLLIVAALLAMTVFFVWTMHHPSAAILDSTGKVLTEPPPPASVEGNAGQAKKDAQPGELEKVKVAADVMEARLISKKAPRMPDDVNIHGTVVLAAVIDEKGHVQRLNVISGHAMLQGAAIDAAKDWTYEPYIKDGKAVSVQTTINVVF